MSGREPLIQSSEMKPQVMLILQELSFHEERESCTEVRKQHRLLDES
jgi:hypothetical protein